MYVKQNEYSASYELNPMTDRWPETPTLTHILIAFAQIHFWGKK